MCALTAYWSSGYKGDLFPLIPTWYFHSPGQTRTSSKLLYVVRFMLQHIITLLIQLLITSSSLNHYYKKAFLYNVDSILVIHFWSSTIFHYIWIQTWSFKQQVQEVIYLIPKWLPSNYLHSNPVATFTLMFYSYIP